MDIFQTCTCITFYVPCIVKHVYYVLLILARYPMYAGTHLVIHGQVYARQPSVVTFGHYFVMVCTWRYFRDAIKSLGTFNINCDTHSAPPRHTPLPHYTAQYLIRPQPSLLILNSFELLNFKSLVA